MEEGFVNLTIRMKKELMEKIDSARFKVAEGFEIKKAEFVRRAIEKFIKELEK